jgi:hypothetical protein
MSCPYLGVVLKLGSTVVFMGPSLSSSLAANKSAQGHDGRTKPRTSGGQSFGGGNGNNRDGRGITIGLQRKGEEFSGQVAYVSVQGGPMRRRGGCSRTTCFVWTDAFQVQIWDEDESSWTGHSKFIGPLTNFFQIQS